MRYLSQFSKEDTEVFLQYVEGIRKYFSEDANFLLEELSEEKTPAVVLKVKEGSKLYQVESVASTMLEAVAIACDTMVELYLSKKEIPLPSSTVEEESLFH